MAEQAAIGARRAALAAVQNTAAEADGVLADVLAGAHAASREGAERLNAVAAELDDVDPAGFAVDTPLGAREFQKFLIAQQQKIIAVVSETADRAAASGARVESLHGAYPAADRH